MAEGGPNTSSGLAGYIHNVPVYLTDELPAQAAAVKHAVLFNPDFYAVTEREGLTVANMLWLGVLPRLLRCHRLPSSHSFLKKQPSRQPQANHQRACKRRSRRERR